MPRKESADSLLECAKRRPCRRVVGSRLAPLLQIGVAVSLALGLTALLVGGPLWLLVPVLAVAGLTIEHSTYYNFFLFPMIAEMPPADPY